MHALSKTHLPTHPRSGETASPASRRRGVEALILEKTNPSKVSASPLVARRARQHPCYACGKVTIQPKLNSLSSSIDIGRRSNRYVFIHIFGDEIQCRRFQNVMDTRKSMIHSKLKAWTMIYERASITSFTMSFTSIIQWRLPKICPDKFGPNAGTKRWMSFLTTMMVML